MTVTNDRNTLIGKVRLLAQDTDGDFFQDEDLQVFLDNNSASVRLAAADALDTMATNQVLLMKKVSMAGLSTDGPAVAEALRKSAEMLRAQELGIYNPAEMFDIVETNWTNSEWVDMLDNEYLRTS